MLDFTFSDRYETAAGKIVETLAAIGVSIEGKRVADIGCGDGSMALGVMEKGRAAEVVGFDLWPFDAGQVARLAKENGVPGPGTNFQSVECQPTHLPWISGYFDVLYSWSAFEHIAEPEAVAREMRRLITPGGVALVQLFPFYLSEWGSHAFDQPRFTHLTTGYHPEGVELNQITLDELHEAFRAAGWRVGWVRLLETTCCPPPEALEKYRLSDLAIGGVIMALNPI